MSNMPCTKAQNFRTTDDPEYLYNMCTDIKQHQQKQSNKQLTILKGEQPTT